MDHTRCIIRGIPKKNKDQQTQSNPNKEDNQ